MGHWKIGDDNPENGEKYITAELDTLGECTENQGWSNEGKHALEHHESEFRNARWHDGIQTDAVEEALIETSDDASQRVAAIRIFCRESPGISEGYPYQTDYCHDEYRLHQDAEDILLAHQTAVKSAIPGIDIKSTKMVAMIIHAVLPVSSVVNNKLLINIL